MIIYVFSYWELSIKKKNNEKIKHGNLFVIMIFNSVQQSFPVKKNPEKHDSIKVDKIAKMPVYTIHHSMRVKTDKRKKALKDTLYKPAITNYLDAKKAVMIRSKDLKYLNIVLYLFTRIAWEIS